MFDQYLNVVKTCIKNKRLHGEICDELESHLQAEKDFYMEIGYDETAAELKAVEAMGDPAEMGENLAGLHELSTRQRAGEITLGIIVAAHTVISIALFFYCFWNYEGDIDLLYPFFYLFYLLYAVGLKTAMEHQRQAPVWTSLVGLVAMPFYSMTSIGLLYYPIEFVVSKHGILDWTLEFIKTDDISLAIVIDNILVIVGFLISLIITLYPAVKVLKYIKNPYNEKRIKDRKKAKFCVFIPVVIFLLREITFIISV